MLSDYVQQIINDTHIVDHTQLCIEEGEKCWLLHCDVLCCNYDGMSKSVEYADLNNIRFSDIQQCKTIQYTLEKERSSGRKF